MDTSMDRERLFLMDAKYALGRYKKSLILFFPKVFILFYLFTSNRDLLYYKNINIGISFDSRTQLFSEVCSLSCVSRRRRRLLNLAFHPLKFKRSNTMKSRPLALKFFLYDPYIFQSIVDLNNKQDFFFILLQINFISLLYKELFFIQVVEIFILISTFDLS